MEDKLNGKGTKDGKEFMKCRAGELQLKKTIGLIERNAQFSDKLSTELYVTVICFGLLVEFFVTIQFLQNTL